jgi:tRNA A-37 threonylcarbamoyl transferase component Bud32
VVPDSPLEAGWRGWAALIEVSLLDAVEALPAEWRPRVAAFRSWVTTRRGTYAGLGGAAGLLGLLVALRLARRPGDLIVCMEYPSELRGTFSIYLTRKQPNAERMRRGSREQPRRRVSTRTAHHMVARETEFPGLRPRSYWVRLEGVLENPDSPGGTMREHRETRCIEVKRRETVRLDFDLRPQGCPLDVKVLWDGQAVPDASVAVFGCPETLRYARGGTARLELPIGRHTVAVGSGDRVAERVVEIESHDAETIAVELSGADGVVFKGCPHAIDPYLQGDLDGTARALEREGQDKLSHALRARLHDENGETEQAAEHYEAAGLPQRAAELRASLSDFVRAAALFEQTGEAEGRDRAKYLLEQVGPEDPAFADACEMLANMLESDGEPQLAAAKLEACIAVGGAEESSLELKSRLADLLAQSGDDRRSLEVLEQVQKTEPDYPNVTTRIETIRKKLSAEQMVTAGPAETVVDPVRMTDSGSRYDILEQIGRGGMGIVFKARDRRLGRLVALKQLPENLRDHPTAVQLFLREARAAAALNHPNIVTLFDADEEYGKFFITMELLEGAPVSTILRKNGPVNAQVCSRLGLQIAAGLECAHEQGVVHRDIKTGNLFWTNDKVLKIMDFGLAKMIEEVRRSTTVIGGTPYYMAPEQITGQSVDGRADIYALGVTFFELVTGSFPFPGGDVAYHHRHTPPPDPRSQAPELPEALAELILHMLEKQPENRCASAAEVTRRLNPLTA